MALTGNTMLIIIAGAVLLDLAAGDPRRLPHPVIGIGLLISFFDKKLNTGSPVKKKVNGIFMTTAVVLFVLAVTWAVVALFYHIHFWAGVVTEMLLIWTTIAIKGLKSAALAVAGPLSRGDMTEAREHLGMIVGRDTEGLGESEIVRGTVETVAENTTDGITAPLFWAMIGGAPLAMVYRAVNTLDSMVGYKNKDYSEFGWASARLDDAVNWVPARLTAAAMWMSSFFIKGNHRRGAWQVTLRDAPQHPSPNSGWTEAMAAALMGVQLGGRNTYNGDVSERAKMGDPLVPLRCDHIKQSLLYMHGGWIVFTVILSVIRLLIFI